MTLNQIIFCLILIVGLAVMLFQLCFDLYLLQRLRGFELETNPDSDAEPTERYYERFFQTPAPSGKLRALYVSEQTYNRYVARARCLMGEKSLYHLSDAILRDHLENYAKQIDACIRHIPSKEE